MAINFTEVSKRTDRGPNLAANARLIVDREDWSDKLISARVTYTTDAGGSGLEIEARGSLEGMQDAPISLYLGYGRHLVKYFGGRIMMAKDNDRLFTATATAFGPFRLMADQVLGTNESFIGQTMEYVIMECAQRAGHTPGEIVVENGRRYRVQAGESFPFDNSLMDVVNTIMEKAEFVGADQPGGRRLFMPKPRPGSTSNFKTTYGPNEYHEFSLDPKNEMSYSKVVVYRMGTAGTTPSVYEERAVENATKYGPPPNRWYVISDFVGEADEAAEEAYRMAVNLREREKTFSMTMFFNPDLHLYDGFRAVRIKRNNSGTQQRTSYACRIDNSIEVGYSAGEPLIMTVTGSAYEIKRDREEIKEPPRTFATSSGILSREEAQEIRFKDAGVLWSDTTVRF